MQRVLFGDIYVSISSWTNKEEAKKQSSRLRQQGYKARTIDSYTGWTVLKGSKRNQ